MGYDPDRFDQVDGFWLCKICRYVLHEPTMICASDHIICRGCIPRAAACPWPQCKSAVYKGEFKRDVNAARFIDTLVISCEECDWQGSVKDEPEHAVSCAGRQVPCPNKNCTVTVAFGDVAAHLELCPERLISCANSPACAALSRPDDAAQHLLICEFTPCRWQASGCRFRGPAATVSAHEEYCTCINEELIRLRSVEKEVRRVERRKKREARRAAAQEQAQVPEEEAAQARADQERKARKEERAKLRAQRKAERAARKEADADAPRQGAPPSAPQGKAAVSPQGKGGAAAPPSGVDDADTLTDVETGSPRANGPVARADPAQSSEVSSINPLPSPANSTEGRRPRTANGADADSISSSCGSPQGLAATAENKQASGAETASSQDASKPSSFKKRSRDDGHENPASPKRKRVRIRLPSPFLQPDTDEEASEDGAGGEAGDSAPDSTGDAGSDNGSEELDDLVVTSVVPGATEEGEVEESIQITADTTPTPASLLAKYHASKPVYAQTPYVSKYSTGFLDFTVSPHELHYKLPGVDTMAPERCHYDRTSLSVSPVLRSRS